MRAWTTSWGKATYHNPVRLAVLTAASAFFAVVAWRASGAVERGLFALLALVFAWLAWGVRIVADDEALHLYGLRHRRIPWSDVARIDDGWAPWWTFGQALVVRTQDGRTFRSSAVSPVRGPSFADARTARVELQRYAARSRKAARREEERASRGAARPGRRPAALARKRRRRGRG